VQPLVDQLKVTEGFTLISGADRWVIKFARKFPSTISSPVFLLTVPKSACVYQGLKRQWHGACADVSGRVPIGALSIRSMYSLERERKMSGSTAMGRQWACGWLCSIASNYGSVDLLEQKR
jgi:hypothetical protein